MPALADERREEVILIAADLFDELGYERTSMATIAARVGESRATLNAHFACKEELLRAVLDHRIEEECSRLMNAFQTEKDFGSGLIRLGLAYRSDQQKRTASMRAVTANPIAKKFYDSIRRQVWQRLAERFAEAIKEAHFSFERPRTGVHSGILDEKLSATEARDEPDNIVNAAMAAAEAFLEAYPPPLQPGDLAL